MSLLISICLVLPYCILLLTITAGVISAQQRRKIPHAEVEPISIVIAARNEEENIGKALTSLLTQDYPSHSYEVIVVDDHSEDATLNRIPSSPQIRQISLPPGVFGKKAALRAGVAEARFPYIAVTDADCTANPLWIRSFAEIIAQGRPALIVGPVTLNCSRSAIAIFQQWEFRALQMVTFGSAALKIPTLCNGANLCFSKEEYTKANLKEGQTPSGDDIFLLHHLIDQKKVVEFCLTNELLVTTKPEASFSAMIQQKLRWASKSKHITNPTTLVVGGITFLTNLIAVACIPYIAINGQGYLTAVWIWGLKVAAEAIIVFVPGRKVYGTWPGIQTFIASALLMPFYATFVATASLFLTFTWKKRTQR